MTPRTLVVGDRRFTVGRAAASDVPEIVGLLRDDPLGAGREVEDTAPYLEAFAEIDTDPHQLLVVVRDADGAPAGTLQLSFLRTLSRAGALRVQIEAVRVARSARGTGLGTALFTWAHDEARARGAVVAQLTTDRSRTEAHRFYARLGYVVSHDGLKLAL